MTTSKLYQGERSPRTMRRYYFPRHEATSEDIQKLNGIPIKDALLRCGKNQKNGKYSNIWKFVSLIFADGTEYKLHGTLLPWHRFGDNYLDYGYEDHDIRAVFSEMKKLKNGKFRPVYDYHNVYQLDNQYSSSEVEDIIDDMREDGAQFSFND